MDSHWGTPNHRKRKRRRGVERPPLPAQLLVDTRLKGDVGLLSEDLFVELFPAFASNSDEDIGKHAIDSNPFYVAIRPHLPFSFSFSDHDAWTFVCVKKPSAISSAKQPLRSTLKLPASSFSLQAIIHGLQKAFPSKGLPAGQLSIEIQVLDAVPLPLHTVIVGVDHLALRNLEHANREFQERQVSPQRKTLPRERNFSASKAALEGQLEKTLGLDDERLESAIRIALQGPRVVHAGDELSLPFLSHPITHALPPPAIVELCEPVLQGLLLPTTKIVLVPATTKSKRAKEVIKSHINSLPANGVVEEEEDTSNEQFYSAAEQRGHSPSPSKKTMLQKPPRHEIEDNETSQDEETDLSENEEDTIGLSLPTLPSHSSGVMSAFSSATPRAGYLFNNGTMSPGSVISSFSTSTVRAGGPQGRLFEAQPLVMKIPNQALHPKPTPDEDDEARVFVDTTSLVRIGCFSGDWVRIEAAVQQSLQSLSALSAFPDEDENQQWRVAKVYALPGLSGRRPRYAIDRTGQRKISQSISHLEKASLKVHISPLLLANLGGPQTLRIASLAPPHSRSQKFPSKNRITSSSMPPMVKEVRIVKYSTPITTERIFEASLQLGLKKFFESRRRLVRNGDMIAIPIDPELGRASFHGTMKDDQETEEILLLADGNVEPSTRRNNVAWFKVGSVISESAGREYDTDEDDVWGENAWVSVSNTRMSISGTEYGKVPEALANPWKYYLGAKGLPTTGPSVDGVADGPPEMPKPHISKIRRRLRELIAAATSPQAIYLKLPPVAILLVSTQRHIGKSTVIENACADLGLHTFTIDAYDILTEGGAGGGDVKTQGFLKARAERGLTCGPEYTALLLKHIDVLNAESMSNTLKEIVMETRVTFATTSDVDKLTPGVRGLFTHELEMSAPDEGEREGLLRDIIQDTGIVIASDVELAAVAVKTAALVAGDLVDVVDRATVAQKERLEKLAAGSSSLWSAEAMKPSVRDIQLAGGDASRCITKADFDIAVDAARKNFADAIGAPKIPNVGWNDVGGLTNVKDAVMETIQLPLERPELFAKGMKKRSGILFYGPPGTGKTLLAKAIATEFSLNFFSVKGPELLNMYIGESEANVRRVFQRARDARPCVVFFDELDSVAPKRGNQGDSGGVMDRIVSQLLAELDGMSNGEDGGGGVFVIGATNRPDLLDQALLRPGRFDKMLYLGVSDTHDKQLTILDALTRKFALSANTSLAAVASRLPFTYTGADLYALCSDAMLKAITRRADSVDAQVRAFNAKRAASSSIAANVAMPPTGLGGAAGTGDRIHASGPTGPISVAYFFDHLAKVEDTEVVVDQADFEAAMQELVPSVSVKELEHYDRVRKTFEQGPEKKTPAGHKGGEMPLRGLPSVGGTSQHSNGRLHEVDDDFVLRTADLGLSDTDGEHGKGYEEGAGGAGSRTTISTSNGKGKGKAGKSSVATHEDSGFGEAGLKKTRKCIASRR